MGLIHRLRLECLHQGSAVPRAGASWWHSASPLVTPLSKSSFYSFTWGWIGGVKVKGAHPTLQVGPWVAGFIRC